MLRKCGLVWALSVGILFTAAGCDNSSSSAMRNANIRVLHASPDAPNVDVAVDGTNVLTNVPYKTVSDYLGVSAKSHKIEVFPTGTTTAVITANLSPADGSYTTIAAADFVGSISAKVLTDDHTAPAAGNFKLRLFHGSPSAGPVDIYVTGPDDDITTKDPTLANVPFLGVSDYLTEPAGTYRVRITPTGTKTVAIDTGSLTFASGQVRTGVALDATGGGAPLTAIVLNDLN